MGNQYINRFFYSCRYGDLEFMNFLEESLIKQVSWDKIRNDVKKVNPELCQIIDKLDPSKKLKLIKASYTFGDLIIKDGILQSPSKYEDVSSTNPAIPGLNYSQIPLSLLLNKSSEIFVHENDRAIPLKVFSPGMLFGTFETIDYLFGKQKSKIWSVSAGSRSIFTLPRISENTGLRRLKTHYKVSSDINARSIADHWNLFKQIAQNKNFSQPWQSDVLFFTKEWFDFKKNDPAWFDFQTYLFKKSWIQSIEAMTRYEFAIYWQDFIKAITHRRIQPTPYFTDSIKHIMLLSVGESPAFQPAIEGDLYAPIQGIQEAILNVYMIKKYFPTIMHAEMMKKESLNPFYYSLSFPTLLEGSPNSKSQSSTVMLDQKHFKLLMETSLQNWKISKTMLKNKNFEYFHVENDADKEILSSKLITEMDKRFIVNPIEGLEFCGSSPFWRGCIMISNVND